jgi:hypothetical protein
MPRLDPRQMGPACMEANCTFRLSHPAIKSHNAHHVPEYASEFFRAVFFLEASARKGEGA